MGRILPIFCLLISTIVFSQNVQVDSQTYTPQQLIEDILINSNCIENVTVTNVVGGNFGGNEQSYGYFDSNGGSFPFQSGIVLSTGKLNNVPGPNNSLSDDDAPGWIGDSDLETILNETNTINATIIEFDFRSLATQVSFRFLFASEEYREGSNTTCQYSDLFGFLIRPSNQQQYTNIALVPETQTPIKVTTVHPEIPGSCAAINETYFGSWNGTVSPINFNGQTKILKAKADLIPNLSYHVKLVIADHLNYRYDSAVFLEAGSFQTSIDFGPDRLLATNNAICENSTYTISAGAPSIGGGGYKWFKDGTELIGETNSSLEIDSPGVYSLELDWGPGCTSYGEVVIEFSPNPTVQNSVLVECDTDQDGVTFYNLYEAEQELISNDQTLILTNFYLSENDALNENTPIQSPNNFQNTSLNQTVYALVENINGCFNIAELQLQIANNVVNIPDAEACDGEIVDGFTEFNLDDITASIQSQIPNDANVNYYLSEADAFNETNSLISPFTNTIAYAQSIFAKIVSNNQCFAISIVNLVVLSTPSLLEDESTFYCLNSFPQTIRLDAGVENTNPNSYSYEWVFNGNPTTVNTSFNDINETGTYTVTVTDPNGCSASRNISVLPSNEATIESVSVIEATENNTITIKVSGEGDYLFTLDHINGFYQESNTFTNVQPGFHTVYVRDINGCGITEQLISILGFPKFVTPNGDGFNDTWKVYGVNSIFNRDINVKIFNRFGKFLIEQNNLSPGWDGTLNGYPLPGDDYWFLITFDDGRTYRGHFALVR